MSAFYVGDPAVLRAHLGRRFEVCEPRDDADGAVRWRGVTEVGAPFEPWSGTPFASPKRFFFAEREALFNFDGRTFTEQLPQEPPRVLFGVNACDLTAIAYQDRFFAKDPAYRARRERTVLVGLDCERPCAGGFCATVEAGPTVHAGTADLVLARDDDGQWVVFASSEAGEAALAGFTADPVDEEFFTRRAARARAITARFPEDRALRAGIGRLAAGEVPAEFWDGLGLRCFTCSGCTQLCPTCSCSTTIDTPVLETRTVDARTVDAPADGDVAFVRERVWDSCLYEGFQKEASGHHPAARLAQRVERFWFHKFAPEFAAVLGRVGCVGCGRCDITCLGGIGARSVLRRISEAAR